MARRKSQEPKPQVVSDVITKEGVRYIQTSDGVTVKLVKAGRTWKEVDRFPRDS